MSASSLTLFTAKDGKTSLEITSKLLTSGNTTAGYLSLKQYSVAHKVKGAAARRAHTAYRIELGFAANANISAKIANGDILAQSVSTTKDGGFKVKFVPASMLGVVKQPTPMEAAATLSETELLALLEAKQPKKPAQQPTA